MRHLANYLERRFQQPDSRQWDINVEDFLIWQRRYMGLRLRDEILWLGMKTPCSVRTRLCNIGNLPGRMYLYPRNPDAPFTYTEEYLCDYFAKNQDNPYAIWNYFQQTLKAPPWPQLTQLPPLATNRPEQDKRRDIERMRQEALPGDQVFTYDRSSGLAHLIRKYDWGMWSHVALVNANRHLTEATTDGVVESSFDRLCEPSLDVALYRIPDITEQDRHRILDFIEDTVQRPTSFNWYGVLRIFLHKRFGIPYKRRPSQVTPNELIYGNSLQLVCYA